MAENNTSTTTSNKYVSPSKLSLFLDNLRNIFSPLEHTHELSEISDYTIDTELSFASDNPIANSTINAEFEAVSTAMNALELAIDGKANSDHNHDDSYDAIGSAQTSLDTAKEYTDNKIANMIFIGTYAEYETANANGQIPINTFVILTDDKSSGGDSGSNDSTSPTTSMLGYAVLGQMILG